MLKDTIKTIVASLIVLSLISVASAWTEPTSNPPSGNASAPINNSSTEQAKLGDFGIKGLLRGYTGALFTGATSTNPSEGACPTGYYWVDGNGNGSKDNGECKIVSLYVGSDDKRVGIGTTTPGSILEIRSRYTSVSMLDEILRLSRADGTYPTIFKQGVDGTENILVINNNNKDMLAIKNGRVGIGTDDPGSDKFSIVSDRDNILNLSRKDGTYPTIFKQGTDDALVINNSNKDALVIKGDDIKIGAKELIKITSENDVILDSNNNEWTRNVAENKNWRGIAVSRNGEYITAVANEGIFRSTNSGMNWGLVKSGDFWSDVSMSFDGKYQTAVVFGGKIYTSDNYGSSWTARDSERWWRKVDMSFDGRRQMATVDEGGLVYKSEDYGQNWSSMFISSGGSNKNWRGVAVNSSSAVAVVFGEKIYKTYDMTILNELSAPASSWTDIAISTSGKYVTAVTSMNKIYTSNNYGITWTARDSSRNWMSVAMSDSGLYQVAVVLGGKIYISRDYGITWTAQESNSDWHSVDIASENKLIVATVEVGRIYQRFPANNSGVVSVKGGMFIDGNINMDRSMYILNGNGISIGGLDNKIITTGQIQGQILYLTGYAKLTPQTSAPVACSSDYKGSIAYASANNKFCVCNGTSWVYEGGAFNCGW